MNIEQIYRDGKHFDRLFPSSQQRPQFWINQAHQYGDPILELACGTGRVSIPLAQEGFHVVGIDSSPPMLEEARYKAAQANVAIDLHEADIRDFDLDQQFSFIFLPNNTLCHLLTLNDFELCMACVKKHLSPTGKFIVEVFVPDLHLLLQDPNERAVFSKYPHPDGKGQVTVTITSVYDSATQIKYNKTFHKMPDQKEEIEGTLTMRMYFPQELDALFKYNGFTILHKYGDHNLTPFNTTSSMQLFVLTHK
jgi:SAM-dependent methyltransferase